MISTECRQTALTLHTVCSHGRLATSVTSLRHILHVEDLCDNDGLTVLLDNPASVSMSSPCERYFCDCHGKSDVNKNYTLTCITASSLH